MSFVRPHAQGTLLELLIQPNASKTSFVGEHNGRLKLRIASPPVDGKANACLEKFLAKVFGISKSKVIIVTGETGRRKDIVLCGVDSERASRIVREYLS